MPDLLRRSRNPFLRLLLGCAVLVAAVSPPYGLGARTANAVTPRRPLSTSALLSSHSATAAAGVQAATLTPTLTPTLETVWVEDAVPAGAALSSGEAEPWNEPWNWIGANPPPFAGGLAHQSAAAAGLHQHYFYNAAEQLSVAPGDTLFAYVYLDPNDPPSEVMLQWNDGTWEHRAYWGANQIGWGVDGTESRRHMGVLPAAGQWVRLEVPAGLVGLGGRSLSGMAFTLFGGRATWDRAGKFAQQVSPTPTPNPTPLSGDAVRFLEQATWGPTTELVSYVQSNGFDNYLNEQFAAPASSYPTLPLYPTTRDEATCPSGSACQRDNYTMYPLQNRFFTNALYGQDQLRQRVAFALHQIFVVSGVDITQPSWMAPYLQILDRNAFGNYRQLLYEITLNPAMGNYLDMAGNTRTNPNENYAREVLQLFSIGTVKLNLDGTPQLDAAGQPVPAYTQTTVNNFARVFTGWRFAPAPAAGVPNYIDPMVANESQHDTGSKTLLNGVVLPAGRTALQDLNGALDNIFNDPNVGPFISKQIIQHLVTSNPSPAYVARVASVFNDNGAGVRGDLKAVVRAVLLDGEARGDLKTDPNYGRLRHPAQFICNILRAFNAMSANRSTTSDGYLNPQSSPMGMDLFRPPSVFSYYSPGTVVPGTGGVRGPEFGILSTSTALRRANFVNTIVFSNIAVSTNAPNGTSIDLSALQALAGDPAQLVERLNQLMMHGTMSVEMRNSITGAVSAVSSSNPLKRARTAVYLVATSSQYQVER